jgi:uncharacterized membrane protein YesL
MSGSLGGILKIPVIIVNLVYLNFLWIVFSIMGLFVFGFFPATSSMYGVIRKWVMGDLEVPIFKTFWTLYKKEFIKSNLLGLVLTLVSAFLLIDIWLIQHMSGIFMNFLRYFLLMIAFIYALTLLYVLPVFVHYELKVFQIIKTAFSFMVISPYSTIMMFAGGVIIYFTIKFLPGLLFFLGGSLISLLLMWSSYFAFSRRERKLAQDGKGA